MKSPVERNRATWRCREEGLGYIIRLGDLIFKNSFHQAQIYSFYSWRTTKSLTHRRYESRTGTGWFSVRNSFGGPRLPNTSIVINVLVLQQGHFSQSVPDRH
jgi:hypothetical protein